MVPLLKFYFHEEVRQAAVQAMPELLRAASLAVAQGKGPESFVKQMLDYLWLPLMESMQKVCACCACLEDGGCRARERMSNTVTHPFQRALPACIPVAVIYDSPRGHIPEPYQGQENTENTPLEMQSCYVYSHRRVFIYFSYTAHGCGRRSRIQRCWCAC